MAVFASVWNHLDTGLLLTVDGLSGGASQQQSPNRPSRLKTCDTADCQMQRCVASLVMHFKFRLHR